MRFGVNIEGQFGSMTGIQHYTDSLLSGLLDLETEHQIWAFAGRTPSANALGAAASRNPGTFRWIDRAGTRIDVGSNGIPLPTNFRDRHRDLTRRIQDIERRVLGQFRGGATDRARAYDVLHYPQPCDLSFWEYHPRRSVATIHDLSVVLFPEAFPPIIVELWTSFFRFARERCARVITVSESSRRDIVEHLGISADRIDVTPNAPRLSASRMEDTPARRDILVSLLPDDLPFVLYSGTLEPRKNLVRLVRAFAAVIRDDSSLPHKLVLAGGTWENHVQLLRQTAIEAGLGRDRLVMTGYVTNDRLNALMSACDLFVYVSLYEGFGMPPLEAMVCGAPVLASNSSSLPEVLGDAALLVDPLDDSEIAIGLRRLLTNRAENQRLRAAAAANVERFSWANTAQLTLESYERAAT